jgi:hypothetical protein
MAKKDKTYDDISFPGLEELKTTPAELKEKSGKLATITFFPDDLEFFKNWIYHMKTTTGDLSFTQKEGMHLLLKTAREKYKDVKERPEHEKEREKGRGRPKLGS